MGLELFVSLFRVGRVWRGKVLGDTKVLYSHLAANSVVCFAQKDLQFSKLEQRDEMVSPEGEIECGVCH